MKKQLIFLFIIGASISLSAQNIPNVGFESWTETSSFSIDNWFVAGAATRTTDAYEGGTAVRLENNASTQSKSFVASGPIGPGGVASIPYDEAPLSMRFRAKYNLAAGDKAQIVSAFRSGPNYIAVSSITIEGNSMDTFTYFSVPIQYQISTIPDSVAVIITSLELDSNTVNGDGYIVIDDLHFASISTRNKDIPNGNFNSWSETQTRHLDGWQTTDSYLFQISGQRINPPIVSEITDDVHGGSTALELRNRLWGADTMPGVIFTGPDPEEFETPSFPINQKWKYIEGFYKYNPEGGDSATIAVSLFKSGVPIGGVQAILFTPKSDWSYFAFEFQYLVDITPDSATLFITNSNPDQPHGLNTTLVLDDVQFTNQNLGVFDLFANKLNVFPNPFRDEIHLSGIQNIEDAIYEIRDARGRLVKSGDVTRNLIIDMRNTDSGIYFLHIEGEHVLTDKIVVKE